MKTQEQHYYDAVRKNAEADFQENIARSEL